MSEPSKKTLIRCRECGAGDVRATAKPGRYAPFGGFSRVPVPDDLEIPTCDNCGAEWFDGEYARTFDEALAKVVREQLVVYGPDTPSNTVSTDAPLTIDNKVHLED